MFPDRRPSPRSTHPDDHTTTGDHAEPQNVTSSDHDVTLYGWGFSAPAALGLVFKTVRDHLLHEFVVVGKVKTVLLDLGLIRTSTPLSSPSREHLVSLRSYVQDCLCIVLRPFAAGLTAGDATGSGIRKIPGLAR